MKIFDEKIKNSKNVIEKSDLNNPDEIYNKVSNKQKQKRFNLDKNLIFKYSLTAVLFFLTIITTFAIYSSNSPKIIIKNESNLTTGLSQTLSNKVKNPSSKEEIKFLFQNSLIFNGMADDSFSENSAPDAPEIDGEMGVVPDVNIEHTYNTNIQVDGVDEADIVKVNGNYIYYVNNSQTVYTYVNSVRTKEIIGENAFYVLEVKGNDVKVIKRIEFISEEKKIAENEEAEVIEHLTHLPNSILYTDRYVILSVSTTSTTKINYKDKSSVSKYKNYDELYIYDIKNYDLVTKISVPGFNIDIRLIDNELYVINNYYDFKKNNYEGVIPQYQVDDTLFEANIDNIFFCPFMGSSLNSYVVIFKITLEVNITIEDCYYLSPYISNLYVNKNAIYLINKYSTKTIKTETDITTYSISKILSIDITDGFKFNDAIEVYGNIEDRYWIDEYNGYLRIASTGTKSHCKLIAGEYTYDHKSEVFNRLTIFKKDEEGCYKEISSIQEGLGEVGEKIESARFNGNVATIVTFLKTDPLYYIDLTDPLNPVITSELKVTGFSEYQHPYKDNYVIGIGYESTSSGTTIGYKIALYDISDKENVKEVGTPYVFKISDGYFSPEVLNNPKELFLDLDNGIFGFKIRYGLTKKMEDRNQTYYGQEYYLFKINEESENPLTKFFNKKSDEHAYYLYNEFERMVFIKDKYYLISYDKVYTYELTNYGLVPLSETYLY